MKVTVLVMIDIDLRRLSDSELLDIFGRFAEKRYRFYKENGRATIKENTDYLLVREEVLRRMVTDNGANK